MKKRLSVFVSLLLVQCILFSLAACQKDNADTENPTTDPADSVFGYFEENYESYTLYDDILSVYAQAQAADYYGGDVQQCGNISPSLVEEMQTDTAENSEYELVIVYVYVDLCDDNEPELFIGRRHKHHPDKFRMYDAWGCKDGKPHRLFGDRDFRCGHYEFFSDGRFCFTEEDTANTNHCIYYELAKNNTDPVLIEQLRWEKNGDKETFYRFDADGTGGEIDESQYRNKKDAYRKKSCHTDDLQNWYAKHPASHVTEPTQETTVLAANETLIEDTDLYSIVRIDNSEEKAIFYFDLLQIKGNSPAAQAINQEMTELYEQYTANLPEYARTAQEGVRDLNYKYYYHFDTLVRYNQNNILSFTITTPYYMGGVASEHTTGYTYRLDTFEKPTLTQLFSHVDKEILTDCCKQALLHYLDKNNLMFDASFLHDVLAALSSDTINYYIDTDGDIAYIYNKYELGPGAFGMHIFDAEFSVEETLTVPTAEQLGKAAWWHLYKVDETAFMNIRCVDFDADTGIFASGWYASEWYETASVSYDIDTEGTCTVNIDSYSMPTQPDVTTPGRENLTCSYRINMFGNLLVLSQLSSESAYKGDEYGTFYVYYLNETA